MLKRSSFAFLLLAVFCATGIASAAGQTVVVMTAGDIQHGEWSEAALYEQTARILDKTSFDLILGLGDMSNDSGSAKNYASFDKAWGRHKAKIWAVPGSHDDYRIFGISRGKNFYDYFNGSGSNSGIPASGAHAGQRGVGYFAAPAGSWLVIGLNYLSSFSRKFAAGDAQMKWLEGALKAKPPGQPVVVLNHTCRYTKASNHSENESRLDVAWEILERYKPDVRLFLCAHMNGIYERWVPMNNERKADTQGIRSFTVGTGGMRPYSPGVPDVLLEKTAQTNGVLKLTLRPKGYDWEFLPISGQSFTDKGKLSW